MAKIIQQVNNNGSIPGKSSKSSKPRFFSPKERAKIGKLACSIGATAAVRHFSKKLGYTMNESTVRGLKQAYLTERRRKRLMEDDLTVHELPMKKKGRPLLLGKKLDDAIQEYILKLREHGSAINTFVVAVAKGLALAMDRTRLAEYGGPATLTIPWAKSLLKRMNFTKKRATTKCNLRSEDLEEVRRSFLTEILETVSLEDIPAELIFNWDQTGINLVPTALWTMDKRKQKSSSSRVPRQKANYSCNVWQSCRRTFAPTTCIWWQNKKMLSSLPIPRQLGHYPHRQSLV